MSRRAWLVVLLAAGACGEPHPSAPVAAAPAAPTAVAGPPAAALALAVTTAADAPEWQQPAAAGWGAVPPTALLLSRTPPSFATDPVHDAPPPAAEVRTVRAGAHLYVRLRWDDPTEERFSGPTAAPYREGRIYKRPTSQPAAFYDGAAVMVPQGDGWRARFPSLVMGDGAEPVTIYFWRDGDRPQVLSGHGRGTVARTPASFTATVARAGAGWVGVFVLPAPADAQTPLAFAVWDGAQAQRNGDKFYSPWYRPAAPGAKPREAPTEAR